MPGGTFAAQPSGPIDSGPSRKAFLHARSLSDRGAYPEAIAEFQEGLRGAPDDRFGLLGIAEAFRLAGDPAASVRVYDALLAHSPDDLEVWRARAEAYRALRNPPELLYCLTAIVRLDPSDRAVQIEKSEVHEIVGETRAAHDSLRAVLLTEGPDARDPALYLRLGDLASKLSSVEEAEVAYQRVLELDPHRSTEVTVRRVRLLVDSGRPDLALERLESGLAPNDTTGASEETMLLLRAEVLSKVERPAEARAVYEQILRTDPTSAVAVAGIAHSLMEEGKHSEARDILRSSLGSIPRDERLVLLLAEAESGLGNLEEATSEVRRGLELLPSSGPLWARLAELGIARDDWEGAAEALAHALELDPGNAGILLRSGFVAERRGRSAEALGLYERAVEIAPHDATAWTRRGIALLAARQPETALESFDRALQLDPESAAAKDGRKAAGQKKRELTIDRQGLAALRLEAELHRPITKNDMFVSLRVPFELLDPVLTAMGRTPKIDVYRLPAPELAELEASTVAVITAAVQRWPGGIEVGALTLADVATLTPEETSLESVQRLFAYLEAVLHLDIRPENLELTHEVEELARHAMSGGQDDRTIFQLVRDLRIGIFKARLIQAVERAGGSAHAPLPALTIGGTAASEGPTAAGPATSVEPHFFPNEESAGILAGGPGLGAGYGGASRHPGTTAHASAPLARITHHRGAEPIRCIGCGGIAAITHVCGAPICDHCLGNFRQCPKCLFPVDSTNTPLGDGIPTRSNVSPARTAVRPPLPAGDIEAPTPRATPPRRERKVPRERPVEVDDEDDDAEDDLEIVPRRPVRETPPPKASKAAARPAVEPPLIAPAVEPAPPPRPPRRLRTDEEPRL